ncbi:MAG: exo-alpha-sialidase [Clostridia bacterium]|nr:exo-alpha-sialidase [Clostridia bacterium]
MRGCSRWSYSPYRPFLTEVGDPYLCRIAPREREIRLEWLGDGVCEIFFRVRGEGDFCLHGVSDRGIYDLTDLTPDTDYEIYITRGNTKSRIRLARTGSVPGTVVNYLHPEDTAYTYSGRYLCSPSLLKHPDGYLLASMDVFAGQHPQNLTLIFRSDDGGKSWHYQTEVMPCFWGKLFLHKGEVYLLGVSTEYGDLLIGKSRDGGKTFDTPTVLLRGANGKNGSEGVHKNPQNLLIHKGRIYNTLEWGTWKNKEYGHAAMVMSCSIEDDLTVAENWIFTDPVPFNPAWKGCEGLPTHTMTIEGTLTLSPEGRLLNLMRFGKRGQILAYEVDTENPHAPLKFHSLIDMPTTFSKFTVQYDPISRSYYSIICRLHDGCPDNARNLLSLIRSKDLAHWETVTDLLDYRHCNPQQVGFQYVDFLFDGEDLIYLCRTALNQAANFHDSNYSTFHRLQSFRDL